MESLGYLMLGAFAGAAIGGFLGWWMGSRRPWDQRLEAELRENLAQSQDMASNVRDQLAQAQNSLAKAEAQREATEARFEEQKTTHEDNLRGVREAHDKAMADLREAFKALSADALKQSHPEFLRLANETFAKFQETAKGDLAQRQQAIHALVKPLEDQLKSYQERLAHSHTSQTSALGEVRKQLELLSVQSQSLALETQRFRMVLKSNPARGKWGEETLRRVVESAGLSGHCDFSEQMQAGDAKPDLVVHLPGDRVILIDSKVPDLDFLEALETADPSRREQALSDHAAKLKNTIRALADRDYPSQFPNALDYVVLFLPAESLFSAALEGDRDLIVWAAQRRILLATPASLIALLRSVSVSWQQHAQTENAQAIALAAEELFARVCKFTEHFERIRAGLDRANQAFNEAVGSYERMVKPSGERLIKLGANAGGKTLPDVDVIEKSLRPPPASTLDADPEGEV